MKNQLLFAPLLMAFAGHAGACDKVDYVEARDWSTARLQKAYCDAVTEDLNRVVAKIQGKMAYGSRDAERCQDQKALYERLLTARKRPVTTCKASIDAALRTQAERLKLE